MAVAIVQGMVSYNPTSLISLTKATYSDYSTTVVAIKRAIFGILVPFVIMPFTILSTPKGGTNKKRA